MLNKLLLLFAILVSQISVAQVINKTDSASTIVDVINGNGFIFVDQPSQLRGKIGNLASRSEAVHSESATSETSNDNSASGNETQENAMSGAVVKSAGYRVQVFSDNNVRTAKSEARSKAQAISSRLPQYRTYVEYKSPYWRLKVGDFLTKSDAENAADEIKKMFPAYAREVRVVTDRINRQ